MGETDSAPPSLRQRALAALREVSLGKWFGGFAVAVLVGSAAFGGTQAEYEIPDALELGKAYDVGPLTVTVDRAVVLDQLGDIRPQDPDNQLIVIVATLSNAGDRPATGGHLSQIFYARDSGAVADRSGEALPRVFNIRDTTQLREINPGTSYEAAFVYEQVGGWDSEALRIGLNAWTWVEDHATTLYMPHWRQRGSLTEATIPVEFRASDPADEEAS